MAVTDPPIPALQMCPLDKNRNERQKLILLIEAARLRGIDSTDLQRELHRLVDDSELQSA